VASCICWSICFILQVPKQPLFFSCRWKYIIWTTWLHQQWKKNINLVGDRKFPPYDYMITLISLLIWLEIGNFLRKDKFGWR
jgi:hypothetical protein